MVEIVKLDRTDEETVELKLSFKDTKRIRSALQAYAEEIENEDKQKHYIKLYEQFVDIVSLMTYGNMGKE